MHIFISYLGGCSGGFIWTTKPSAAFLCGCCHTSKRKTDRTTAACRATNSRIKKQEKEEAEALVQISLPSWLAHCPASQDPLGTGPASTNEGYSRCKSV